LPLNDTLAVLKKAKIVKRIVSTKFDGVSDSYIFKVRVELINGWLLDYWEHKTPNLRRYSFHVFFNRQMIVRWDNTPHYPELKGFPHHKHEGKTVIGSTDMTIHMVLEQLEKLVTANSSS
jgi:hypothetical protein